MFAHSHSFVAAHITFIPLLPELQSPHFSSINITIHRLAVNIYPDSGPVCLFVCSVPAFLKSNHKRYFFYISSIVVVVVVVLLTVLPVGGAREEVLASSMKTHSSVGSLTKFTHKNHV